MRRPAGRAPRAPRGSRASSIEGLGERVRGAGRDEAAAPVGEPLAGVGVRRRDDRLAGAHRVRERPGHDLLEVRVRRDEDVGSLEPGPELRAADEAVDEPDVVGHAEDAAVASSLGGTPRPRAGAGPGASRRGSRRAPTARPHDRRHRRDRGLVALAGAEQPEAQDHRAALEAEARLDAVRRDERQVAGRRAATISTACGSTPYDGSAATPPPGHDHGGGRARPAR